VDSQAGCTGLPHRSPAAPHARACVRACVRTCMRAYVHACVRACVCACVGEARQGPPYTEERPTQRRRQREREQLLERWSVRPGSERSALRTLRA
jgi:hypothetical protein